MKRTVMAALDEAARKWGSYPALRAKHAGVWQTTTWSQYLQLVRQAARGMIKLGLQPKQGVSIIGFNCPEWSIADLAAIYAGGVPTGIYTTSSPEQCLYIASHSESAIVIVEDHHQLAKFLQIRAKIPSLKAIIMMHGGDANEGVYSWADLLKLGEEVSDEELDKRIQAQAADDLCTLIYTSGTTGDPKGVMISHDNITWTAATAFQSLNANYDDRMISYLPLSHIAEQIVSLHGPIAGGACTSFAESMDLLGDNLREVRPTIFLGVPRVWEKIQGKIVAAAAQNSGLKKRIGAWARQLGLEGGYAEQAEQPKPFLYGLANKLVFSKVREKLGLDRCRVAITSAAPIARSTLEFFLSLGIPILEVYGMSECTGPATLSLPNRYRTGSAGPVLAGAEIKAAEDGEICMRGRHVFLGYYKNEEATKATMDSEGWLHSGDIGEIDKDGFVRITDRKKDLLITAGGENVAPQPIENLLKGISGVSQAVVIGDRQKHLSALFTLDETKFDSIVQAAGSSAKDIRSAAHCSKVEEWLMKQVEEVNKQLSRAQAIKKIKILDHDLSIEDGELTPTMKVKRKIINQKYAADIDSLYM